MLSIIAGIPRASSDGASRHGTPITGPAPDRGLLFRDYALFPRLTVHGIEFGPHAPGQSAED